MDVIEIRRENLRTLAKQAGSQANLARQLEMTESHLGSLIGRTARSAIGHTIARRIEKKLNLPRSWLDQQHAITGLDPDIYFHAAELAEAALLKLGITPKPKNRARLYLHVYRRCLMGNLDVDEVMELVLLMT